MTMIESLIISLREGVEIALVIGILVVYLKKIQQPALVNAVYVGLILAIAASIGGSVIFRKLAIDQESLEGYFELAAALFVISMIVWMWMAARRIRRDIEARVKAIIDTVRVGRVQIGIAAFTFFMIVREGIETAIFLQAVAFSTGGFWSLFGIIAGFTVATLFAVLFIRGSVKIDIARFLKVTAVTLLIFTFQLITNAFHEFYEYGVLPANPKMMALLGPVVQHNVLFIIAIISIPAIMLVIPGRRSHQLAFTPGHRQWQFSAGIAAVGISLFLGVGDMFSTSSEMDLSSEPVTISGSGTVEIRVSKINDGKLHRFSIDDNGLEIRFIVLRTGLGKFAAAFDACYACYSYGRYYLKNGQMICSQCDAPSPISKLHQAIDEEPLDENNTGSMEGNGCAPIYLPSRMRQGNIEIALHDLQRQRKYFDISDEK